MAISQEDRMAVFGVFLTRVVCYAVTHHGRRAYEQHRLSLMFTRCMGAKAAAEHSGVDTGFTRLVGCSGAAAGVCPRLCGSYRPVFRLACAAPVGLVGSSVAGRALGLRGRPLGRISCYRLPRRRLCVGPITAGLIFGWVDFPGLIFLGGFSVGCESPKRVLRPV